MSRHLAFGLALLVSLYGATARADASESDSALAHGVALRRERRDAEALSEFRRAYSLDPSARALAQIALAEAALERWVTAENDLLRVLAGSDPWIDHQRAALRIALEEVQAHLGTLVLTSNDGAEAWIDGAFAARLPAATIRAPAGHLVVEVRAAGFATARREIDLAPATTARESIVLEPETAPPEAAGSPGAPVATPAPPSAPTAAGQASDPATRPTANAAGARSLVMPLVLGGVGVAGLITGAYFGIHAMNLTATYNQECANGCTNLPPAQYDTANKTHADAQTSGDAATIAFVAGGVSLAGGITWWLVDRARSRRQTTVRVVPLIGREMNGFLLEGEL